MTLRLTTEQILESLSVTGGNVQAYLNQPWLECHIRCWKSHVAAQLFEMHNHEKYFTLRVIVGPPAD